MIPKICNHLALTVTLVAHETLRVKSPADLPCKGVRPLVVSITPAPRADNRTRRCRFRTGFFFYLWQRRSGSTGEERRENCAWTAHEESAISRRGELLHRRELAGPANGSI